ncbi:hypothetical protein ACFE04_015400 [Oxalis oulophora]
MASQGIINFSTKKRFAANEDVIDHDQDDMKSAAKKSMHLALSWEDPAAALASARHEFGEHGGVNMSIEASATFTVMEPETMRRMFTGELGADRDFFIYSRHFNPTVLNLSRMLAALEGTEAAYCTSSEHPQHELLKSLANKDYGYGGLLGLDMETEDKANRLMNHLQNGTQFGLMAVSLGYYETLMSCSGNSTSSELNAEEKAMAGISQGLVRISVGYIGSLEQKWGQFEKALTRLQDLPGSKRKLSTLMYESIRYLEMWARRRIVSERE